MASTLSLIEVLLVSVCVRYATSQCTLGGLNAQPVVTNETALPGTLLLTITRPANAMITFTIRNQTLPNDAYRAELQTYLELKWTGTSGSLTIKKTLDLEEFSSRFGGAILTSFELDFTCDGGKPVPVTIINNAVNEFTPEFNGSPYYITLDEMTPLNSEVIKLEGKAVDLDVPPPGVYYYSIETYGISQLDAKDYFAVGAVTLGNVRLIKPLSFKDKPLLRLNVSVMDSNPSTKNFKDSTTVFINVTDADNQNPYFNLTGCPKPCIAAPYFAVTSLTYKGTITVLPEPFHVGDDDTLKTTMLYSIQSGDASNMFQIDQITGAVSQLRSVTETDYPGPDVRLVIQVKKNLTSKDLSNIAILTVRIAGRTPVNETNIPRGAPSTEGSETSLLIPVIALAVLLLLLIIAIIVVVLIIRKKHREMKVSHETTDKSEPQTEEEDLQTDRSGELPHVADTNEKTTLNGKTTQGMTTDPFPPTPSGRASTLPPLPLKDSATETMDSRKKKRSRRRNKNKEPEVFDGTMEYNMGAEPEFFDSSDKSKVKRSQRSYDKKVDPALWIKVPNDNPANYDSGFSG